jgi:hypothetical protein
MRDTLGRAGVIAAAAIATAGAARADASPVGFMGDPVVAIGVIVVLVLIIWFVIRGALSLTARDKDDDDAGVGVLEGIDEDDEEKKRR